MFANINSTSQQRHNISTKANNQMMQKDQNKFNSENEWPSDDQKPDQTKNVENFKDQNSQLNQAKNNLQSRNQQIYNDESFGAAYDKIFSPDQKNININSQANNQVSNSSLNNPKSQGFNAKSGIPISEQSPPHLQTVEKKKQNLNSESSSVVSPIIADQDHNKSYNNMRQKQIQKQSFELQIKPTQVIDESQEKIPQSKQQPISNFNAFQSVTNSQIKKQSPPIRKQRGSMIVPSLNFLANKQEKQINNDIKNGQSVNQGVKETGSGLNIIKSKPRKISNLDKSGDISNPDIKSDQKMLDLSDGNNTATKDGVIFFPMGSQTPGINFKPAVPSSKKPSRATTMHQNGNESVSSSKNYKGQLTKKTSFFKSQKLLNMVGQNQSTDRSLVASSIMGNQTSSPERNSNIDEFIKMVNAKRDLLNKKKLDIIKKSAEYNLLSSSQKSDLIKKARHIPGYSIKDLNLQNNKKNGRKTVIPSLLSQIVGHRQKSSSSSGSDHKGNKKKFPKQTANKKKDSEFIMGLKLIEKPKRNSEQLGPEDKNEMIVHAGVKRILNVKNFFQEAAHKDDHINLSQLQNSINIQSGSASQSNSQNMNPLSNQFYKSNPASNTNINQLFTNNKTPSNGQSPLLNQKQEGILQTNQLNKNSNLSFPIQKNSSDAKSMAFQIAQNVLQNAGGLSIPNGKKAPALKRRRSFVGSKGIIEDMIDRATTPRSRAQNASAMNQEGFTFAAKNAMFNNLISNQISGKQGDQTQSTPWDTSQPGQIGNQKMRPSNFSMMSIPKDEQNSYNVSIDIQNHKGFQGEMSSAPLTADLHPESMVNEPFENRLHQEVSFSLIDDQVMLSQQIPYFLINPTAVWKSIWNALILILIMFLAIVVPYRISFEDQPPPIWVIIDNTVDFLFVCDLTFNFFTCYEDENGVLVTSRKKIVTSYVRGWFTVDTLSSIPITAIQQYGGLGNGVANAKYLKLSRLPRLYRLLRLLKLIRLYKSNKIVEKMLKTINVSQSFTQMAQSLVIMMFLLHLIGCMWATVSSLGQDTYPYTWDDAMNINNMANIDQYVAASYWACVTILTVGYGDIVPVNILEYAVAIIILFVGVSLYAYTFSKLSTLFSSVNSQDANAKTRDAIISDLAKNHSFTPEILYFYSQNQNLISLSKEYAIDELVRILPAHLKAEISFFLYKDAIDMFKIFQGQDQRFYAEFISKFEPMRIKNGTVFAKEGQRPQEVFFLLKGEVQCQKQQKHYREGTIFGEVEILLKRNRQESYIAEGDCYILKLERSIFEQILEEFPKIKDEILMIVVEREKMRIEKIQQNKIKQDVESDKQELEKLMSKINFEEIKARKNGPLKKKGTFTSADQMVTFGGGQGGGGNGLSGRGINSLSGRGLGGGQSRNNKQDMNMSGSSKQFIMNKQSSSSNQLEIMSFGPNSPNKRDLREDRASSQRQNDSELIQDPNNDSDMKSNEDTLRSFTYRDRESLETIQDRSSQEEEDDDDENIKNKKGNKFIEEIKVEVSKGKDLQQQQQNQQQQLNTQNIRQSQSRRRVPSSKNSQIAPSVDDQIDSKRYLNAGSGAYQPSSGDEIDQYTKRSENKRISVQNVETQGSDHAQSKLHRKITNHMTKIENLKIDQVQSIAENQHMNPISLKKTYLRTKSKIREGHKQKNDELEEGEDQSHEMMQLKAYQEEEIYFGSEGGSHRPTAKDFTMHLRESLQRLRESVQQEEVVHRPSTHRDLPVSMGNKGRFDYQNSSPKQQNQQPSNNTQYNNPTNYAIENLIINMSSNVDQDQRAVDQEENQQLETQAPSQSQSLVPTPTPPLVLIQPSQQFIQNFSQNLFLNQARSGQVDSTELATGNLAAPTPEHMTISQLKPIIDEDLQRLNQYIQSCKHSIKITRHLILEYIKLFEISIEQMGDEANEIIRRQYNQGMLCLQSYVGIMNLIEKLISQINMDRLNSKVTDAICRTNETEKRFYFLENKVKVMNTILDERIAKLQKDKERIINQKPVVIVRRNPLLDERDSKHAKLNENLMFSFNKKEMNL